jgi:ribosomal protein L7/L12
MSITSEAKQEVERLLRAGQKIEAIRYTRDTFGVSLEDAKRLVDAAETEMDQNYTGDSTRPRVEAPPASDDGLNSDVRARIEALLRDGKKIEAVKYVKEQFRLGLKEALQKVEAIHREIDPNAKSMAGSGCAGKVLVVLAFIFAVFALACFSIAGITYYLNESIVRDSDRVTGVVVDMQHISTGSAPVIEYTIAGKVHQHKSIIFSKPPSYRLQEQVPLYASHENPEVIVLDTFSERWLGITIFGGVGILFTFFTIMAGFASRRF